jgi:drug/metabolite transporter (DMT)-like permease
MWRIWVAALFWGLNWPAVKILLTGVSPWALRALGLAAGALVLTAVALVLRRSFAVPRRHWARLIVAGLFNLAGFNIFAAFAQLNLPTSRAAILTFTMPLWSALFAWVALGERIDRLRTASLAIGAVGLAVLIVPFWPVIAAGGVPIGLVYVLGAAISWAAGTVWLKKFPIAADPFAVTIWQIVVGAIAAAAGMAVFETPRVDLSSGAMVAALAYHIVLPQALVYILWFDLLGRVSSTTATLGTLLIPVFAVLGAMIVLGERPAAHDMAGFALILAAVGMDQVWRGFGTPPKSTSGRSRV